MDEKFRKTADEQFSAQDYVGALPIYGQIKAKTADDYRRMAVCEDEVGHERIREKNFLSAIAHFTSALSCMRDAIAEKEIAKESDASDSRRILSALLNAMNDFLATSLEWETVAKVLEDFLRFYVVHLRVFNKNVGRLSHLDKLSHDGVAELWNKAQTGLQRERAHIYLATVELFQGIVGEPKQVLKQTSPDPAVKKVFDVYTRALELKLKNKYVPYVPPHEPTPEPELEPEPVPEPVLPSAVAASSQAVQPMIGVPRLKASAFALPFDQFATGEKMRAQVVTFMTRKNFTEARRRYSYMLKPIAGDFRRACECDYEIGNEHFKQGKFQAAIESYKEALRQCKYISNTDMNEGDQTTIATVFTALLKALDKITENWSENFGNASQSMANVLDFYVDHFDEFHCVGKKLPGLDEINIDNLIPYLDELADESSKLITKIYLTIIAMFRQDAKLQEGELSALIDEFKITAELWSNDEGVSEVFYLFQKALNIVQSTKYRTLLNPELQTASEPDQKRGRWGGDSSSSSSHLSQFGLGARAEVATPDRPVPQTGPSQAFTK